MQCTLVQRAVLRSHVVGRPSVRLSVCCDVGDLWSHMLEILETNKILYGQLAQYLRSLQPKDDPPILPGECGNFGETRGWVGKWHSREQKRHFSMRRIKMEEKLLWRACRNSPTLFRTVPSPTPYGLPFLEIGGLQLSYPLLFQEYKATDFKLAGTFTGPIRIKAH